MESLEAPSKRAKYGTNYGPAYTYSPLAQTYSGKVAPPTTTSHSEDSELGSCASAIRSALDLFSDETPTENGMADMLNATPASPWKSNYEPSLPSHMMGVNGGQKYYPEFAIPQAPGQMPHPVVGRNYPGTYHNNNNNTSVNKYYMPDAYAHYPGPGVQHGTQQGPSLNNHPVLSKMEQRFAGGGKNDDYLQNYAFNGAAMNNANGRNTPTNMNPSYNHGSADGRESMSPFETQDSPIPADIAEAFLELQRDMSKELDEMTFTDPVTHVYNPMNYAYAAHENFVKRFCTQQKKILFLGMNPGPYGMAQTGVPFGEVSVTRDWLGVKGEIGKPECEHPKRPVLGFACSKKEVSGARFWGFFKRYCQDPEVFFTNCFVHNACPLLFVMKTGKNVTPTDLPAAQRKPLMKLCDRYLAKVIKLLGVNTVVGVGKFATDHTGVILRENGIRGVRVVRMMHPSPANPVANREWEPRVTAELVEGGVWETITGGMGPPPEYEQRLITPPDTNNSNSNSSSVSNSSIHVAGMPEGGYNQVQGEAAGPPSGYNEMMHHGQIMSSGNMGSHMVSGNQMMPGKLMASQSMPGQMLGNQNMIGQLSSSQSMPAQMMPAQNVQGSVQGQMGTAPGTQMMAAQGGMMPQPNMPVNQMIHNQSANIPSSQTMISQLPGGHNNHSVQSNTLHDGLSSATMVGQSGVAMGQGPMIPPSPRYAPTSQAQGPPASAAQVASNASDSASTTNSTVSSTTSSTDQKKVEHSQ